MEEVYEDVLIKLEGALDRLVQRVPPAQRVPFRDGFVYRYIEQTAEQALIQKLARLITGLRAAHLLLKAGLVQEQGVIQRVLGDFQEDVFFLGFGILKGEVTTGSHATFLADFYQEEFDNPENPLDSTQKRSPVGRRKIHAYLARVDPRVGNPSDNQEVARTLHQAFSGFVHGASSQIMDMYGGNPPRFRVRGMLGTPRMRECEHDIWNYFERVFAAFAFAAIIFHDQDLVKRILSQQEDFHVRSGRHE